MGLAKELQEAIGSLSERKRRSRKKGSTTAQRVLSVVDRVLDPMWYASPQHLSDALVSNSDLERAFPLVLKKASKLSPKDRNDIISQLKDAIKASEDHVRDLEADIEEQEEEGETPGRKEFSVSPFDVGNAEETVEVLEKWLKKIKRGAVR